MTGETLIESLFSVWEAAAVKPRLEDLCRTCPELLEPLRVRIEALQAADRLLNSGLFETGTVGESGQTVARSEAVTGGSGTVGAGSARFPQIDDYQILREVGG